jgi:YesN/AraC family two-component response regulator
VYKVLLVDDEPHALDGLGLTIDWQRLGCRIAGTYRNGEEAMRHIRREPPDLVVTDIRMPVMDGLALIEEARRSGKGSIMFVIASGYHDFDYAVRALRLGVSHYLTKPVIGAEAEEVLSSLIQELHERERFESASGGTQPNGPHAPEEAGIQAEVAEFLRVHYKETFTIREIAERFYVHPVYLGQSFTRRYGIGILEYVHELRIEDAKRQLGHTDASLSAISESVGYNGYQHFLKHFEKRAGMKPTDYRLQSRKGERVHTKYEHLE